MASKKKKSYSSVLQDMQEFLSSPPGVRAKVTRAATGKDLVHTPRLLTHCRSCGGDRYFEHSGENKPSLTLTTTTFFLFYTCRNCGKERKTYTLSGRIEFADKMLFTKEPGPVLPAILTKFGELPFYAPSTPPRLMRMLGGDKDLFLKGRRCESQGLGIAAYAYYRRIVENMKDRFLDEIRTIAEKTDSSDKVIALLREAKSETQFTQAIGRVKDAIPTQIFINEKNPIGLLHALLSVGLHSESDAVCLRYAVEIRHVLSKTVEAMNRALQDGAELQRAVRLLEERQREVKRSRRLSPSGVPKPRDPGKFEQAMDDKESEATI